MESENDKAMWTAERIARLERLLADPRQLTTQQIARELGGVSRSAVIGKAGRLGLQLPNHGLRNPWRLWVPAPEAEQVPPASPRCAGGSRPRRSTSHFSIWSRITAAGLMAGACPSHSAAVIASPVHLIAPFTQEKAVSKPNRQAHRRDDEERPQQSPPPSLATAMNMLAGLNERLDQNLAQLSSLACALGGAQPGEISAAPANAPASAGIAREFVDHLQAAHRRIDEIEHAAQRLANAIEG